MESSAPKLCPEPRWHFNRRERLWLAIGALVLLVFGGLVERRTALHRTPRTDLGVFACAAQGVCESKNLYEVTDWHGWHYQYPPLLAILFRPLALPLPDKPQPLPPGEKRTLANTPWGYAVPGADSLYGLHRENARFFVLVAVWYLLSVLLTLFSLHALACVAEAKSLLHPPPVAPLPRAWWWSLRIIPLLVYLGSIGTDLSRGQVDLLVLGGIALALYLVSRDRRFSGGLCLALPVCIKLFPTVLVYPLWRQNWRMALGVAAGLLLGLVAIPMAALGPTRTIQLSHEWFDVLVEPALGQGTDASRTAELTGMTATDNQSLLAFLHNWQHHNQRRGLRPVSPAPASRIVTYVTAALVLGGLLVALARRPQDPSQDLLVCSGLLVGVGFLLNPVVHHYYYLLLMPLATALTADSLARNARRSGGRGWKLSPPLLLFMLCDLAARLPWGGGRLRDWGIPMLSMLALMGAGVTLLLRRPGNAQSNLPERVGEIQSPQNFTTPQGLPGAAAKTFS